MPMLRTAWYTLRCSCNISSPFVVIITTNTPQIRRVHNNRCIAQNMIWKERDRITALLVINVVCLSAKHAELIYVLTWTNPGQESPVSMSLGQQSFIQYNCEFKNCFITDKFSVPLALSNFAALLFYSTALIKDPFLPMPSKRINEQKYVFVSTEPAARYPITNYYNNFFNWTWTYKLHSDIVIANVAIKDENEVLIGPKKDMRWTPIERMKPLSDEIKNKIKRKSKAVAWFVQNCDVIEPQKAFILDLRSQLAKHKLNVYILGECGKDDEYFVPCSNRQCHTLIQSTYYFHLSFETSMSEDYVTDQLLVALNNYAVPIVFGGANYTRYDTRYHFLDCIREHYLYLNNI